LLRKQLFGTEANNVQSTCTLEAEMEKQGHFIDVHVSNYANTQKGNVRSCVG